MRKSILIGVLAALVLFAFTACEPQVVDLTGGNRTAQFVVVTQNTPFIEGQDFIAENFDVAIYYSDGGEPQVLPGTGIVEFVDSDKNDVVNDGDKVKANITTTLASKELAINVIALENCEISDVKLSATAVPSVYVNEDAVEAVDLSDSFSIASVTYTYENVTYISKTSSDFSSLSIDAEVSAEAQKTIGTVDITVTVKDGETVVAEIPATCNVVKNGEDTPDMADITSMTAKWTVDGKEVEGYSTSVSAKVGATVSYKIYGVTSDNQYIELSDNATAAAGVTPVSYDIVRTIAGTVPSTDLKAQTARVTFVAGPSYTGLVGKVADITLKVTPVDIVNKATVEGEGVVFTYTNHTTQAKTFTVGEPVTITPADFTAPDGKYTVETTKTVKLTCVGIDGNTVINPSTIDDVKINIVYTWTDEDGKSHNVYKEVTVDVVEAEPDVSPEV